MSGYDIDIGGMTCDHCAAKVTAALESVPGVRNVSVDLAGRSAAVSVDDRVRGAAVLLEAIRVAGFSVNGFRRGTSTSPKCE